MRGYESAWPILTVAAPLLRHIQFTFCRKQEKRGSMSFSQIIRFLTQHIAEPGCMLAYEHTPRRAIRIWPARQRKVAKLRRDGDRAPSRPLRRRMGFVLEPVWHDGKRPRPDQERETRMDVGFIVARPGWRVILG